MGAGICREAGRARNGSLPCPRGHTFDASVDMSYTIVMQVRLRPKAMWDSPDRAKAALSGTWCAGGPSWWSTARWCTLRASSSAPSPRAPYRTGSLSPSMR